MSNKIKLYILAIVLVLAIMLPNSGYAQTDSFWLSTYACDQSCPEWGYGNVTLELSDYYYDVRVIAAHQYGDADYSINGTTFWGTGGTYCGGYMYGGWPPGAPLPAWQSPYTGGLLTDYVHPGSNSLTTQIHNQCGDYGYAYLWVLVSYDPSDYKEEDATDGEDETGGGDVGSEDEIDESTGDPINTATGNMYHHAMDFSYSELLEFDRWYNSNSTYLGDLGYNWTHTYSTYLEDQRSSKSRFRVLSPTGRARYYISSAAGSYYADDDGNKVTDNGASGFTEVLRNGKKNFFDSSGVLIRVEDAKGNYADITRTVAGQDKITTVVDNFGRQIVITDLGGDGYIDQVTDPYGRDYEYNVDIDGNLGYVDRYVGTSEEERCNYGYAYSAVTDLEHKLTSATLTKGGVTRNLAHWDYDTNSTSLHFGKATTSSIDPAMQYLKHVITFDNVTTGTSWTSSVFKATDTTGGGTTSSYNYSKFAGVYKPTSIDGDETKGPRTYDIDGNLTSVVDERGNETKYFSYDSYGRPGGKVEAYGTADERYIYYTYNDATGKISNSYRDSAIDPDNYWALSHAEFDSNNRMTSVGREGVTRDINGQQVSRDYSSVMSYNSRGLVTSVTDPNGNVTTFGYYSTVAPAPENGRLKTVTNPLGHTVTYSDYASGKPAKIVEDTGVVTLVGYYDDGTVESITVQDAETAPSITRTASYTYNPLGDPLTVTMPDGKTYTYEYDTQNNWLLKVTDGAGNYVQYEYYADGKQKGERTFDSTDTLMKGVKMFYDTQSRLNKLTEFNTPSNIYMQLAYDGFGNMSTLTDHRGRVTEFKYDALNRLKESILAEPETGHGTISNHYGFDINDKATSYTDGESNVKGYVYDDFGRVVEAEDAEGGIVRYGYDASGNLTEFRDANGRSTRYEYDALGNMTKKTYADGKTVRFEYRADGKLRKKTNARGITASYSYNGVGELVGIDYSDDTPDVRIRYESDKTRIDYIEAGANRWDYSYDSAGRVHTVDGPWASDTVTYAYDGMGRITSITPTGSDATSYTYTSFGNPLSVSADGRTYTYGYEYDADPVPQTLTGPDVVTTYTYDNLYRIKSILSEKNGSGPGAIYYDGTFTYNDAHIRTGETVRDITGAPGVARTSGTTDYQHNPLNQMTDISGLGGLVYDMDGNLTGGYTPEGYRFTAGYDAADRLSVITYTDGSSVTHTLRFYYRFDGFMYRQVAVDNGAISDTRFVRGMGYQCLQERDETNAVTRSYVWDAVSPGGIGGLLAVKQSGNWYSYIYDGKGNVSALVDTGKAVVAQYRYDEFGSLLGQSGTFDQPYKFSTKRYYDGFGISYYGYRFYEAAIGRWLTRDPIGLAGGLNLYGFVGNSAVSMVDEWGLLTARAMELVQKYIEEATKNHPDDPMEALKEARDKSIDDRHQNEKCAELAEANHYLWAMYFVLYGGGAADYVPAEIRYGIMVDLMNTIWPGIKDAGFLSQELLDKYGLTPEILSEFNSNNSEPTFEQMVAGWEGAWDGLQKYLQMLSEGHEKIELEFNQD